MNVSGRIGCLGGDHRTGSQPRRIVAGVLARITPDLVNASHHETAAIGPMDEERLLLRLALATSYEGRWLLRRVPLVEAVGRQNAASGTERALECRLLGNGLQSSVDHPGADRGILRPRRHQPPHQGS